MIRLVSSICLFLRGLAMPQPLSRVAPNANVRIGNVGDYPLRRHPDLALLAAEVIASWSNVEAFTLRLFVDLMGGSQEIATTVFLALEVQSQKSAAINAVAAEKLGQEQRALLAAILACVKSNQKRRDKIGHWTWGDTPQIPDALLLINPKNAIDSDINREQIFVYKNHDFDEIIKANERLAGFAMRFGFIVREAPQRDLLFAQLCAEPEIRERLDHLASQAQSPDAK